MGENKTYTCPNTACRSIFIMPLKTLNLQETPTEPYYACPICLTKIETPEQAKLKNLGQQSGAPKQVDAVHKQRLSDNDKPASCQFHLGYLSERGKKEIPDNCLTCMDIVECMLKKMREEQ
jgi:hypothetical protein